MENPEEKEFVFVSPFTKFPSIKVACFGKRSRSTSLNHGELRPCMTDFISSQGGSIERAYSFSASLSNQVVIKGYLGQIEVNGLFDREVHFSNGIPLHYGASVDGILLEKGEAGYYLTGDCPTAVFRLSNGSVIMVHAGRESILSQKNNNDHGIVSAVHRLVKAFHLEVKEVGFILGISGRNFSHPFDHRDYGEKNRKMIEDVISRYGEEVFHPCPVPCVNARTDPGLLNLFGIFMAQCRVVFTSLGSTMIYNLTEGELETYENSAMWWSRRRWSEKTMAEGSSLYFKDSRNVVLVMNG